MVPSSPPEIRSDPSLLIVRQDTGLVWAGNDFRMLPEGMERA
jgi:hypothetical protein